MEQPSPSLDVIAEARRTLDGAQERGLALRLMGGVAILVRCPSAMEPPLARAYNDIDFFGRSKESRALIPLFEDLGYRPEPRFNALHGHRRLLFKTELGEHRDVLLDRFEMCHTLELGDRLEVDPETLPLADLLLTKLQVFEANAKDLTDAIALLVDHAVGSGPDEIDADYIARLCGNDWGLERTITEIAGRVVRHADGIGLATPETVGARMSEILNRIERQPRTRRWKLRARVGERVKWYETPEEVG
jgi:hypothetical protein